MVKLKIYFPGSSRVFVSWSEQIWIKFSLHHLLTMDLLQWMGAVRMRVQTAYKNKTIINKQLQFNKWKATFLQETNLN